jgi:uncharacterized CHY-type Zn-finger protein
MSKFFSKCGSCHKRHFFIEIRTFTAPNGEEIKSKELLCGKCAKNIRAMLKPRTIVK